MGQQAQYIQALGVVVNGDHQSILVSPEVENGCRSSTCYRHCIRVGINAPYVLEAPPFGLLNDALKLLNRIGNVRVSSRKITQTFSRKDTHGTR